jgi:tRNA G18 (ribose-2'-O)-methylase SpoU
MKKSVWLHNIRSIHNIGSIFRTADAVGIGHIYLSGYTPLPIDRFGRLRADMNKIALGAEQSVSWSVLKNIPNDIIGLKKNGAILVFIEQHNSSISLYQYTQSDQAQEIIIAMGEETKGFNPELLSYADTIIEIPMRGQKESLNVSVAFGIAAYWIFKD